MSEVDKVGDTEVEMFQIKTAINLLQFVQDKPNQTKRDIFKYSVNYVENVFEHDRMFHNTAKNPIVMSQEVFAKLVEEELIVKANDDEFIIDESGSNSLEGLKEYFISMKEYHSKYDECELFGDPEY